MKKTLAWILVVCVGLFVFACSGGTTPPKKDASKQPAPTAPPKTAPEK